MTRGYCLECQQLVQIEPGARKPGSRERWWWPVVHLDENGEVCSGSQRPI